MQDRMYGQRPHNPRARTSVTRNIFSAIHDLLPNKNTIALPLTFRGVQAQYCSICQATY